MTKAGRNKMKHHQKASTGHIRESSPVTSSGNGTPANKGVEVVTANGVHDYTEYRPLVDLDLPYMVTRRQELGKLIEQAEAEKKQITESILAAMTAAGMGEGDGKVLCQDHVVTTVKTHTPERLSKELLLEKGVAPSLIRDCTVPGLAYVQVRVTKAK